MAYPVSQEFTQKLYSGECNYRATLTIGEQTIDNDQIASISISSPIVDSSTQTFYIGTFISQKITIHFKNMDNLNIYSGEQIDLSIGQYVNNAWVDVPIGKFLIDDLAEDYYEKCEITCLDYAVKFKPNIDYSPCFVDGKANIKTILEYICEQFDVELGDYPTINDDIEVGTYDSTVSGKQWISYIAELKGCNAKMDRNGRLTLQPLKQASNVSINALESASFDLGEKYNITKVTFFDALRNFTYGDDEGNTLFIRQDNPFVTSEEDIRNVYNSICTEKLSAEGKYIDIEDADANDIDLVEIDGNTYQKKVNGYQLLKNTNVDSGDGNYWDNYSTFNPVSRILTRSTTSTTESFITHNIRGVLQPNTTYTLSCMIKQNGKVSSIEFYMYSRAGGSSGVRSIIYNDIGTSWVKKSWTFTTYSNIDYTNSSIRFDNNGSTDGTTAILYVKDVMLEQGSTAHDYEDYPLEPNYPYPINNVCGSNKITINNKNIYDPSYRLANGTVHCSNGTATEENGVFTLNATGRDLYNWGVRIQGEFYVEQSGKLYEFTDNATYICKCTNDLFKNNYVTYYDENEVSLGYVSKGSTTFTFSKLDKPNAKYFSLRFGYANATSGETYSYSVELEKAINLFDRNNANGLVAYINGSGIIKTDTQLATIYIPCKPNTTYTIRKSVQSITANNRFKVGCCASTPTIETQLSKYTNLPSGTTDTTMIFETDSTANYLVFNFAGGTATECQEILNSVQIEYQEQEIQEYVTHQEVSYNIDLPVENLFDKDNANVLNGYITINGTITSDENNRIVYIPCQPNTTYTIQKIASQRFRVATYTSVPMASSTTTNIQTDATGTSITITSGANDKYLAIWLYNSGVDTLTYQQIIDTLQIEKGSKANAYVPYGLIPIDIGENLYTSVLELGTINTSTGANENNNNSIRSKDYIEVEPNTTYTITNNNNYQEIIYEYDTNKNFIRAIKGSSGIYMFTTSGTTKYIRNRTSMGLVQNDLNTVFKLVKGKNNFIDEHSIELNNINNYKDKIFKNSGKNLLNTDNIIPNMVQDVSASVRQNWVYYSNDKSITLTNYNTDSYMPSIYYNANYKEGININVDKNTYYTLSFNVDQPLSTMKNCVMGLNKTTNKYEYITTLSTVTTITFNSGNYDTITFRIGSTASVGTVTHFNNFMLEKGSTVTQYEPYGNGDWYWCRNTGKITLNGSEEWSFPNNVLQSTNIFPNNIKDIGQTLNAISNRFHYKYYATGITSVIQNGEFGWNSGKKLTLKIDVLTTKQEYIDWLGTHNTSIYYQLANSTYDKITYQPLIDQLNAIDEEAGLFEGTNHIIIEPNEETPTLNINYYKNSNFELYSLKTHNYGDFTLDAWDNINYQLGDKNYLTLNNNDIKYEQSIMGDVNTKIPTKQQEVTTNVIGGDDKTNIKVIKTNVDKINANVTILSQQQTDTSNNLSELTVNVNGISSSVQTIQNSTIPSINGDIDAINDNIDGINTTINNQNTTINNITSRLSSVEQTADAITNMFQISGGINIIRNSAFLLRDALWEFTNSGTNPYYTPLGTSYNSTLSGITTSVAEIKLRSIKVKSKSENITNLKIGTKYTFNFYHKQDANVTTTIKMYSTEDNTSKAFNDIVITGQQSLKNYEVSFTPSTYANYTLEIIVANTDNLGYSYMYDMMLNTGDKQSWQPASDEIYSTTLTMSRLGLQVYSVGDGTITLLGTEGLLTYETTDGKTLGNLVSKRTLDGDLVRSTTTQALYVTPNIASVITTPNTPKWVNTTATISSKLTYIEYLESGD